MLSLLHSINVCTKIAWRVESFQHGIQDTQDSEGTAAERIKVLPRTFSCPCKYLTFKPANSLSRKSLLTLPKAPSCICDTLFIEDGKFIGRASNYDRSSRFLVDWCSSFWGQVPGVPKHLGRATRACLRANMWEWLSISFSITSAVNVIHVIYLPKGIGTFMSGLREQPHQASDPALISQLLSGISAADLQAFWWKNISTSTKDWLV